VFALSALILDGFESAAQVLCGEAAGRSDKQALGRLIWALTGWGLALSLFLALGLLVAGPALVGSFSTDPAVVATVRAYLGWAALLPVLGAASFVLDGVFIGAGWTRAMLVTMAAAFVAYAAALAATAGLGNHGLWLAFSLFLIARAAGQAALLPRLLRSGPASATA
jgi:MATE family multidrug resistance protein